MDKACLLKMRRNTMPFWMPSIVRARDWGKFAAYPQDILCSEQNKSDPEDARPDVERAVRRPWGGPRLHRHVYRC